ncbi:MAG: hypothetical protein WCD49_08850 [Candidatus Acidiferrales bacterium]
MAAEQVIIIMAVNFPRMENLLSERISTFSAGRRVAHNLGQSQQFRTEFQTGAAGSVGIDEEPDTIALKDELNIAPRGGELIAFSYNQNTLPAKFKNNFLQSMALRGRNKQDLAADDVA